MNPATIQLSEKRLNGAYIITLGPGLVRYLKVKDFLSTEESWIWIEGLRELSSEPKIEIPPEYSKGESLNFKQVDEIFANKNWDDRLEIHHALGKAFHKHGLPSDVYCQFHSWLQLDQFARAECLRSWVKEAWENEVVVQSYACSKDFEILAKSPGQLQGQCVFRKTPFVNERLKLLARKAQRQAKLQAAKLENEENRARERRAAEDLESLRKSKYNTFVYLMEDLRNGRWKIGQSRTPTKRERTLQSEVPEIVMRLSIPADIVEEKRLHSRYAHKRVRGEWFSLTHEEQVWIVYFLKKRGDTERMFIDYVWFGKTCFGSSFTSTIAEKE
ncbi:MAG: hypothetical protein EPO07_13870 [Verrucomicrobia bacterium]|nr:MAG: hypothetical protein EPO07_13870 [Verrucomicrobiota bacterium]